MGMNLARALRLTKTLIPNLKSEIENPKSTIAIVGSGGKTTALSLLAHQLAPSVATTTTHLGLWQLTEADRHITLPEDAIPSNNPLQLASGVTLVTSLVDGDRLKGLNNRLVYWLHEISQSSNIPMLIEADGSRQKPLKAPAAHEPVIPPFANLVLVVAGMSGLGKPLLKDHIHRPEIFASLSDLEIGQEVTAQAIVRVLTHPNGGLKGIPAGARKVAILNQADSPDLQSIGGKMAKELLAVFDTVLVGSLLPENLHTFEPIAGIVLAAGEAKRFGKPKQLLEWRGKPLARQVAETALGAGLSPVVIVTGAYAQEVEAAVRDLPVEIVHNGAWQSGQASSIRAGLETIAPLSSSTSWKKAVGAAIFLLADQPQVLPMVLRALVEHHRENLAPIIAPQVKGQRANPVLFDCTTFPELMVLSGEAGGRAVFSKFPITYMPWHDESLLLDVDTPQDFARLQELTI
jgi:molybdenum cofactor cytidylyltransferase